MYGCVYKALAWAEASAAATHRCSKANPERADDLNSEAHINCKENKRNASGILDVLSRCVVQRQFLQCFMQDVYYLFGVS